MQRKAVSSSSFSLFMSVESEELSDGIRFADDLITEGDTATPHSSLLALHSPHSKIPVAFTAKLCHNKLTPFRKEVLSWQNHW